MLGYHLCIRHRPVPGGRSPPTNIIPGASGMLFRSMTSPVSQLVEPASPIGITSTQIYDVFIDEHPIYYPNGQLSCKSASSRTESQTRTSTLCIVCAKSSTDSLSLEKQAAEYLRSEAHGKATYKGISHLRNNTRSINGLFGKVTRTLQTYDSESPHSKGALEPQWAALRKVASVFHAPHNLR